MAKNILIILDNGRVHGNTQQLAEAFARGAEASPRPITSTGPMTSD